MTKKLFDASKPFGTIDVVIAILVLVQVMIVAIPLIFAGFVNLTGIANLPFASFFSQGGVMYILVGALAITTFVKIFGGANR